MERKHDLDRLSAASERREQAQRARLDEALRQLEAGIDAILESDGYRHYLDAMGRFHRYSYGNILLILAQRPEATVVAGYRRWQSLDRQVRRGERGITIITPRFSKDVDPDTGEEREVLVGFGTGSVFDIAQTEGEPLPAPPDASEITSSTEAGFRLCDALRQYLEEDGVLLRFDELGGPRGIYSPVLQTVRLQAGMSVDQTAKTLAHETAHHVAMHRLDLTRSDAETIAESAAYVVLRQHGIDSSEYSFPYVARWAQDRAVLTRNLSSIQRVSDAILRGLEQQRQPLSAEMLRQWSGWDRITSHGPTLPAEFDETDDDES